MSEASSGRRRPEPDGHRVTVVVLTHQRHAELGRTLDQLAALPEAPPVIVIDNASCPAVGRLDVERRAGWSLVRLPTNRGAAGRNVGAATATTPYVAFADDDTWWEPGSLDRAADALDDHPSVAVVTAHIVVGADEREDPICVELRDTPLSAAGLPGHVLGSFLAGASVVRRREYLDAGGFEPRLLIGGEEELLAADLRNAGWRLLHLPEMVVHHHPSTVRDPHLRRRQGLRNHMWFLWLRRPTHIALARTAAVLRRAPHDRHTLGAGLEALAGLPWVLHRRRVLAPPVEAEQRLLDAAQSRSTARRYIS